MLHERHKDSIKVSALFDGRTVRPAIFRWQNNTYQIKKILNVHSTFDGRERVFFFSVSTETDFFRLELHTKDLSWFLVEHYQA